MEHNIKVILRATDYKTWEWSKVPKNKLQPQNYVNPAFLSSGLWETKRRFIDWVNYIKLLQDCTLIGNVQNKEMFGE